MATDIYTLGFDKLLNRGESPLLNSLPALLYDSSTILNPISESIPSEILQSGEMSGIYFNGKTSFTDSTNGFRQGIDTDGTYKWIIGTTGNSVDFNVTTANTLTISGALSASTIDIGGADATSFHVDINGNMWLGAATFAAATAFSVSNAGVLTSISGTIAAFTLAATTISATNLILTSGAANTANITVGTGATAGGINSANVAGDIIFWGGSTFANRATAPFRVEADGSVVCFDITITGGSISSTPISSIPNSTATDISLLSHSYSMAFSVTDADTIAWGAGSIVLSNGRTFAIDAGNTGNMAALTYIYLDTAVSSTVLQTTTTYSTAMGANKLLVGMAQNNTVTASFIPFGGGQPLIDGGLIGALSIVAGNIAASTITAGKLSVSQLSAIAADMGTITAGTVTGATIQTASSGARVVLNSTGIEGHDATTQRFDVSNDGSGWLGTSTAIAWTTAGVLTVNGSPVATVQKRAEQLNKEFVFLGGQDDGLTASTSGTASITRRPITTYFFLGANDGADLRATAIGTKTDGNSLDWDDDYEFSIVAQTNVASGFESVVFEITGTLNGNPGTQTQRHIGFYFDDGTVYASNANGTTETRTDISGSVTKTNRTQYRFVYDAGVNILFYVNDVLVATHTTNLPSGTTTPPQFYLSASTGVGEAVQVVLCNNYFLKVVL